MADPRQVYDIRKGPIPPEVERERLEAFRAMMRGCEGAKMFYGSHWATGIAMAEGQQWIEENIRLSSSRGGNRVLQAYPENYDAGVDQIRVTLNRTREIVNDVTSLLRVSPDGWNLDFAADERDAVGGTLDALMMRRVWNHYLRQPQVNLAQAEESQNEWRVQAGSGIIKLARDLSNPYGWTPVCVGLDRMTWDAANKSPWIDSHRQWADTMAWDATTFEKAYGIRFPDDVRKNLPRLGQLVGFEMLMQNIRALEEGRTGDSETPGILGTEFYDDNFARLTMIAHTGLGDGRERVVWDGPNPLGFCPYMKNDYLLSLLGPWGVGIPYMVGREQKITNIVFTSIARHLLAISANQWVYEEGTITDPQTALSPRVGGPIPWKRDTRDSQPPYINKPPDIPSVLWNLAQMMPQMMSDKAHLPPVLMGHGGSREPAASLQTKLGQAERPFAKIQDRDFEGYKRFYTRFATFLCDRSPTALLQEALGPDLNVPLMERMRTGKVIRSRVTVTVPRSAIQPPTPAERKRDLQQWTALKVVRPEELRFELASKMGMPITEIEEATVASVAQENQAFLSGATAEAVRAVHFEPHDLHIRGHRIIIGKRRTWDVAEEVITQIGLHILSHYEQMADEIELESAQGAAAQGQVGATESVIGQAFGDELEPGPLSGSMAAPMASPTDYATRDLETSVTPEQPAAA